MSKRNGTRSTRMERPLSKTEKEKVRASLSGEGCANWRLEDAMTGRSRMLLPAVHSLRNAPNREMPHRAAHFLRQRKDACKDNSDGS
ncbi:hypothetical protein PCAR4_370010 [Paraburkholderia caribensis]|nr:hypothetical protein PCAR4_370010 [Paraburkholderia caribensis]